MPVEKRLASLWILPTSLPHFVADGVPVFIDHVMLHSLLPPTLGYCATCKPFLEYLLALPHLSILIIGGAGSVNAQKHVFKTCWQVFKTRSCIPTPNLSLLDKTARALPHNMRFRITAGFLCRAGAETPLNFREKFRVSPRTILNIFSAVDTQTAVLVSTAEVWISAPDPQTPILLGFSGYTQLCFGCSAGRQKFLVIFLRYLSRK